MSPVDPKIAIVIAAGGDAARMSGAKADQRLGGIRLIDHAAAWARRHSDVVALAVRDTGADWGTGLMMLRDYQPGIGPISALRSGFQFAVAQRCDLLAMIGCDSPFLPEELLARLGAALGDHDVAMPTSLGRDHPMAALWRPDCEAIDSYIAQGKRSLWGFAQRAGMVQVEWACGPDDDPFANINDPPALDAAERRWRDESSFFPKMSS